jgi:hypothetical protein
MTLIFVANVAVLEPARDGLSNTTHQEALCITESTDTLPVGWKSSNTSCAKRTYFVVISEK